MGKSAFPIIQYLSCRTELSGTGAALTTDARFQLDVHDAHPLQIIGQQSNGVTAATAATMPAIAAVATQTTFATRSRVSTGELVGIGKAPQTAQTAQTTIAASTAVATVTAAAGHQSHILQVDIRVLDHQRDGSASGRAAKAALARLSTTAATTAGPAVRITKFAVAGATATATAAPAGTAVQTVCTGLATAATGAIHATCAVGSWLSVATAPLVDARLPPGSAASAASACTACLPRLIAQSCNAASTSRPGIRV